MRPHRYAMGVAALVTTLVVAGCDNGDGIDTQTPTRSSTMSSGPTSSGPTSSGPTSSSPTSSSPTSSSPTETVSPEEQAVLDAYHVFYEAVTKAEADPKQSQVYLEPVATGAQLETTNGAIKARLLDGVEAYGSPILNPEVASVVGENAEVRDCQDTSQVGSRKIDTGEVLTVGRNPSSAKTTLTRVDGVWKVSATEFVEPVDAYC